MDFELRCPSCKEYYQSPVYLPCSHSLCYTCALISIQPITTTIIKQNNSSLNISLASDLDKLSLTSDDDSGISSSSRPSSLHLPPILPKKSYSTCLQCPICLKMIYMDKTGVKSLPKNYLLTEIINHSLNDHICNSIENEKIFCQDHLNQLANYYCLHCRLECCQQCSRHNNHQIIPIHQAVKIYKVNLYSLLDIFFVFC
jgi:hypothetical protein